MDNNPLLVGLDSRAEKIMYIVAGCNGAGKTTAFRTKLYEDLGCPVFINSDEIAREMCPENVESVQISAGRQAVEKIYTYLAGDESFCVETTLATRTYLGHIRKAHENGFKVALFYYWLDSPKLAVARVGERVVEGGHNVPKDVIRERYVKSVKYISQLYIPKVDFWKIVNNSGMMSTDIATSVTEVKNYYLFNDLMNYGKDNKNQ